MIFDKSNLFDQLRKVQAAHKMACFSDFTTMIAYNRKRKSYTLPHHYWEIGVVPYLSHVETKRSPHHTATHTADPNSDTSVAPDFSAPSKLYRSCSSVFRRPDMARSACKPVPDGDGAALGKTRPPPRTQCPVQDRVGRAARFFGAGEPVVGHQSWTFYSTELRHV